MKRRDSGRRRDYHSLGGKVNVALILMFLLPYLLLAYLFVYQIGRASCRERV